MGFLLSRVFQVYSLLEGLNKVHDWEIAITVLMNILYGNEILKRRNVLCVKYGVLNDICIQVSCCRREKNCG